MESSISEKLPKSIVNYQNELELLAAEMNFEFTLYNPLLSTAAAAGPSYYLPRYYYYVV